MKLASVEDVYAVQLGDLRSVETQLIEALPEMADAASDKKLKQAFTEHLAQTQRHLERLEEIIESCADRRADGTSEAMEGMIGDARGSSDRRRPATSRTSP